MNLSLEESIETLQDNLHYTVFLVGSGTYSGSFRIDSTTGAELKHQHCIFELYDDIEIFQNGYEAGSALFDSVESTILYKIEQAIKGFYQTPEKGLKTESFYVLRVTEDGKYEKKGYTGDILSKQLPDLLKNSKTLTILEKGSKAYKVLSKMLRSPYRFKLHREEVHFSEMTPEQRSRYRIGDDYKTDPYASQNNVVEHHKD